MKKEWVVTIRDACLKAGVPFFFKQWGGFKRNEKEPTLDGKLYREYPKP